MSEEAIRRNDGELDVIRAIAKSGSDRPALMVNLNRYTEQAAYPNGALYNDYITGLEAFLPAVGGQILWRHPVLGQPVGEQPLHEILGAWYPTHQAFLDLRTAGGAARNYALRAQAVEYAVIHRCTGENYPFCPPR